MTTKEYAENFADSLLKDNIQFTKRVENNVYYYHIIIDNDECIKEASNLDWVQIDFVFSPEANEKTRLTAKTTLYQIETNDYIGFIKALKNVNELNEQAELYEKYYIVENGKIIQNFQFIISNYIEASALFDKIYVNILSKLFAEDKIFNK